MISFLESPEIVKDEYRWPAALRARALNTPCATLAIAYACPSATISIRKFRGVLISLPGAAAYRVTELHGRIPAVPIRNVARVSSTRATGWWLSGLALRSFSFDLSSAGPALSGKTVGCRKWNLRLRTPWASFIHHNTRDTTRRQSDGWNARKSADGG